MKFSSDDFSNSAMIYLFFEVLPLLFHIITKLFGTLPMNYSKEDINNNKCRINHEVVSSGMKS